jgi:hypothetical protein
MITVGGEVGLGKTIEADTCSPILPEPVEVAGETPSPPNSQTER